MAVEYIKILLALMASLAFLLGLFTFCLGLYKLFFQAHSSEVQALATQTARLVNKGLTEELAGIVGQASELMNTVNQLVKTERGTGFILVVVGMVMMGGSGYLVFLIAQ